MSADDPSPRAAPPAARFWFSSTLGHKMLRDILRARLPFDPHDFLLDWTAVILDGHHLIGMTATGDGKSCLSYFPLLVMQHFAQAEEKPAGWPWPDNPLVLVICPTKGIEEEQEADMVALDIDALALNHDRLSRARQRGEDLWKTARTKSMVFLGPELLASSGFSGLVNDKSVWSRIVLACIDELHLLLQWALNGFRPKFLQIGQLLSRLCPLARICGYSATILPGPTERRLCDTLGLFYSDVVVKRRSNLRANVQFERRVLRSSLKGYSFPELEWIVTSGKSAIVFVDSINTSWHIAAYFCRLLRSHTAQYRRMRVRLYNSLNTDEHNAGTRDLLREWPGTIAIATNALCVGFSSPCISTVVMINPTSLEDVVQKGGRANRVAGGGDEIGRAIVYMPAKAYKTAADLVSTPEAHTGTKSKTAAMEPELGRALSAKCFRRGIDLEFRNPRVQPCHCDSCNGNPISGIPRECACDGCTAEGCAGGDRDNGTSDADDTPISAGASKAKPTAARPRPVSKAMRAQLVAELKTVRKEWYFSAPVYEVAHLPVCGAFPDDLLDDIVTHLHELDTLPKVEHAVMDYDFLVPRAAALFSKLEELRRRRAPNRTRKSRPHASEDDEIDVSSSTDSGTDSESDDGSAMETTIGTQPAPHVTLSARSDPSRQPLAAIPSAENVRSAHRNVPSKRAASREEGDDGDVRPHKRANTGHGMDKENATEPVQNNGRPKRQAVRHSLLAH